MLAEAKPITVRAESLPMDAPVAGSDTIMAVIARAAADPNTNVEKLERMLDVYERITERQAEQEFDKAMSLAQSEMRLVAVDSNNSQTKSKYASFAALDRAVRPIYTKHGFGISYDTGEGAPEGFVRVVCRVSHIGGDKRIHHIDMPADGKGAKGGDVMTKTHATGAALTYGQRYLLKLIFNIAVGEDDDGNSVDAEHNAAVAAACAAIRLCKTEPALDDWRAKNQPGFGSFSAAQMKLIVSTFNAQRRAIQAGEVQ
jgi:hypothetical protein